MNRKLRIVFTLIILVAIATTSCKSRHKHCPGVYSKAITSQSQNQN